MIGEKHDPGSRMTVFDLPDRLRRVRGRLAHSQDDELRLLSILPERLRACRRTFLSNHERRSREDALKAAAQQGIVADERCGHLWT
jgi:hypothetical protein